MAVVEIIAATVLIRRFGTDRVNLSTKLPAPFPPEVDPSPLAIAFEVRRGGGVDYVKENFPGIPTEVIDVVANTRTQL